MILDFTNITVAAIKADGVEIQGRSRYYDYVMAHTGPGQFLEFGVHRCKSINMMAKHDPKRNFTGFDSFEGLPEDWVQNPDASYIRHPKGSFALDEGEEMPHTEPNVSLVKGWFEDSLPVWLTTPEAVERIGILHIDCDLYSSTKTVLDLMNDKIEPGMFLMFDELFSEPPKDVASEKHYFTWEEHEWKALKEWMETYNRTLKTICVTGRTKKVTFEVIS